MKIKRLVVVSNRIPDITPRQDLRKGKVATSGGLVSALLSIMSAERDEVWMGWSRKSTKHQHGEKLRIINHPFVQVIGLDIPENEYEAYYNGFCNGTIWPMFHCFQARIKIDRDEQEQFFNVNRRFSEALMNLLKPDDTVWIHDYHMIPLGKFLREGGFKGPIGFFLHIPFPPIEMIETLPYPKAFMEAWLYYNLVGFHTERYRANYFEVMERLKLGAKSGDSLASENRSQEVVSMPIGINSKIFEPKPEKRNGGEVRGKMLGPNLGGDKLIIGVERLDYTKGIPERFMAMEYLFNNYPQWRRKVSLIQIGSPSRTRVKEYLDLKQNIESLVGRINSEQADHDWAPIRYLYRTYDQSELAEFYRNADVALVTPLRDGMNLVAMEYVASQNPESPGALVLSQFAGVAEYLTDAILVNPYFKESVAEGIDKALSMSLEERKERYHAMIGFIKNNTVHKWSAAYLDKLLIANTKAARPRKKTK